MQNVTEKAGDDLPEAASDVTAATTDVEDINDGPDELAEAVGADKAPGRKRKPRSRERGPSKRHAMPLPKPGSGLMKHENRRREKVLSELDEDMKALGLDVRPTKVTHAYLADLRRARERPITHEVFAMVCDAVADGHMLHDALAIHDISPLSWRDAACAPERAKLWREAQRAGALTIMARCYNHVQRLAVERPNIAGIHQTYMRVAAVFAKALDNPVWGDRVEVDARHLVINTNLPLGAAAIPGQFDITIAPPSSTPGALRHEPRPLTIDLSPDPEEDDA